MNLTKGWALPLLLVAMLGLSMIMPVPNATAANTDWVLEGRSPSELIVFASTELPDGRLFITMGVDTSHQKVNETWIYDPDTNDWEQVSDSPNAVEASTAVAMPDGKVYVFGGSGNSGYMTNVLIYDTATDSWSDGAALPGNLVHARAVAINDHVILIAGGSPNFVISSALSDCHFFDISNSTFYDAPDMPSERLGGSLVVYGSNAYYIGGLNTSVSQSTIFAYDMVDESWSLVGELPESVWQASTVSGGDGNIYIIGGSASVWWDYTDGAYLFNTVTNVVTSLSDLAAPVHSAGVLGTDDGRVIYMLGQNSSGFNTEMYSLEIWGNEASLTSSTVGRGESVYLSIGVWFDYAISNGLHGTVDLVKDNATVISYTVDTALSQALIEISISESMETGGYELVFSGFNVSDTGDREFRFETMPLTVSSNPSLQDQLDDLEQQNSDLQDQIDDLSEENSDLQEQLDDLDAAQADMDDSIAGKLDAMIGYVVLMLALVGVVLGAVALVRKK